MLVLQTCSIVGCLSQKPYFRNLRLVPFTEECIYIEAAIHRLIHCTTILLSRPSSLHKQSRMSGDDMEKKAQKVHPPIGTAQELWGHPRDCMPLVQNGLK
jgi:hypothetical protein